MQYIIQQHYLLLLVLALTLAIQETHGFHFLLRSRQTVPTTTIASRKRNNKSCTSSTTTTTSSSSLSMTTYCENETIKTLYNIEHSGWKSPQWNWGYARGTGHDCAAICRRRWGGDDPDSRSDRRKLVEMLLSPAEFKASHPEAELPFEEIKLILGLAWQRGRWDGSDGGPNGYGAVLATMAEARRYEQEDEVMSALSFIEDVSEKFDTIARSADERNRMKAIANDVRGKHAGLDDIFMARRTCAGMVLDAMNFVNNGL
eukprot:CAMPEP_0183736310 /NCGR_PEP_ID=MMETSP0737-20130205/49019_1 /TAXON_ID=385413 /ORGANISM="Thalassiosira miniscula, Strain CCMP1093" /LENGTH=258 /DNA_ID=CAMNT_0025970273 /DNA_START=42 /DNA_END=818 /DNA_ORIENTATION=-